MDTKLYKWKEELQQKNIQEEVNNNIITDDNLLDLKQQEQATVCNLDKKRSIVRSNMPVGMGIFSQKQSLVQNGKYRYIDSKGREHDASRMTPSSKYMKPILKHLRSIDDKLSKVFNPDDTESIQKSFLDAINACENYLDNRNPWTAEGKARRQMVQDFYVQLKHESVLFANRAAEIGSYKPEEIESMSWLELLRDLRSVKYTDGQDGVTVIKGGAGTSEVFIIEKNGQKKFFKENEKVAAGSYSDILDNGIKTLKKTTDEYCAEEKDVQKQEEMRQKCKNRVELMELVKRVLKRKCQDDSELVYEYIREMGSGENVLKDIRNQFEYGTHEYDILQKMIDFGNEINEQILELKFGLDAMKAKSETEEYKKMQRDLAEKERIRSESDFGFLSNEIRNIRKKILSEKLAVSKVKIEKNAEISIRNVATSRMAKILGLDKLIARSDMATVTIGTRTMTGTLMEDAKGEDAVTVIYESEQKKKKVRYTADAFKDLMNLQVFDIICGQVDRHAGNYMAQYEEKNGVVYFKEFKGIDNDMSFGLLKYSDIVEKGSNGYKEIRNIENKKGMSIPYMDHDLAMRIKALDLSVVDHQMADILTKEERKALKDRIKGVKKVIEKQLAYEKKLSKKHIFFNSRFVGGPDQDTWSEAFEDYSTYIQDKKSINKDRTANILESNTYLSIKCM